MPLSSGDERVGNIVDRVGEDGYYKTLKIGEGSDGTITVVGAKMDVVATVPPLRSGKQRRCSGRDDSVRRRKKRRIARLERRPLQRRGGEKSARIIVPPREASPENRWAKLCRGGVHQRGRGTRACCRGENHAKLCPRLRV